MGFLAPTEAQAQRALHAANHFYLGLLYQGGASACMLHRDARAMAEACRRARRQPQRALPERKLSSSSVLSPSALSSSSELSPSPGDPDAERAAQQVIQQTRAEQAELAARPPPVATAARPKAKAKGKAKGKAKCTAATAKAAGRSKPAAPKRKLKKATGAAATGAPRQGKWLDFLREFMQRPDVRSIPSADLRMQACSDAYWLAGNTCTKCRGDGCAKCRERAIRLGMPDAKAKA